jgi:hypothetical protein
MAFPPPGGVPGPFGPGGSGFPPAGGFGPPGGVPPFGGVVVHRARLLPRLILVLALLAVSTAVTGAIVWFSVLGTADDVELGRRGATRSTEVGAGADDGVDLPPGWPEALAPGAGTEVITSVASGGGTPDEQLVLVVEATGGGAAVVDALRAQLAAAGLTVTSESLTAGSVGSISATGAGWEVSVAVSPNPARPEVTTVSWVLRRGPR